MGHPVAVPSRSQRLAEHERFRGNHGTIINPHRSIATLQLRGADVVVAIVLGLGATFAYILELDNIGRAWTWIFARLASPLGFPGVGVRAIHLGSLIEVSLPHFDVVALAPTHAQLWIGLVITAVALVVSFLPRDAYLPLGYALRLAAMVQCTALLFFWLQPWPFPYDLAGYITTMQVAGLTAMGLVPVMLAATFYVIDARFRQKVGLTLAIVGHLFVFIPLQYALQSYIIARGSLLTMPLCFALFALLPEVMVFIALYGWGMSWPSRRLRGRRE